MLGIGSSGGGRGEGYVDVKGVVSKLLFYDGGEGVAIIGVYGGSVAIIYEVNFQNVVG